MTHSTAQTTLSHQKSDYRTSHLHGTSPYTVKPLPEHTLHRVQHCPFLPVRPLHRTSDDYHLSVVIGIICSKVSNRSTWQRISLYLRLPDCTRQDFQSIRVCHSAPITGCPGRGHVTRLGIRRLSLHAQREGSACQLCHAFHKFAIADLGLILS